MTLSQNQLEALNKPCAKCGKGTIIKRTGRYGDFVSCSMWPTCQHKIYKPRGIAVTKAREASGGSGSPQSILEQIEAAMKSAGAKGSDNTNTESGNSESQENSTQSAEKLKHAVTQMAESLLAEEKKSVNNKLNALQKKIDTLEANQPKIVQVKHGEVVIAEFTDEHYLMPRLIRLISADFNVYLWGDAGTGKTTAALRAFQILKRDVEIDTLDMSTFRSMIQGYMTPTGEPVHTAFTRCWVNGKGYVADENDNCPGHVQTLFNSALANGHAALAWGNVVRKQGFSFVGTGNTPGRPTRQFPDRKPMSAAFMDRLYFVHWPLDEGIESRAAGLPLSPRAKEPEPRVIDPKDWVKWVRSIRDWSKKEMPTLMVTPRASLAGLQALAIGETCEEVAHGLVFRGADEELVHKALTHCPLP